MKQASIILSLLLSACGCSAPQHAHWPDDQLRQDVYWLADDAREGRLPGTTGADQSADYIAKRFELLGLAPAPVSHAYVQTFELPGKTTLGSQNALSFNNTKLTLDHDFRPLAFSPQGKFAGKLAFVGYGVSSPKYDYDDYAGLDVAGRVVIAMRYEPHDPKGKSRFTAGDFTNNAPITRKTQLARSHGAIALLLVNPPTHHPDDSALREFVPLGSRFEVAALPVISISPQIAEQLLGNTNPHTSLASLQDQIDNTGKAASFLVENASVHGQIDLDVQKIRTCNVMGIIPGIGIDKDEYVVIGAHYDHIGRGLFGSLKPGENLIHNGADDNASGTAALMSVAQHLSNHRLSKSVLFVAFSGEESGLHGSRYFVEHSPVPLDKIVAMINLDMVGRIRENILFVGGGGTRAAFRNILNTLDQQSAIQLKSIGEGGYGPSDHQSFALKKVPVLFFFSGLHKQYHHPDDDAKLINFSGLAQTADFISELVQQLATIPREQYVDRFDAQGMTLVADPTSKPATQSASHSGRASLGVIPDYGTDQSTGGVRIGGTVPNTPAAGAGLIEGDVLVGWNDKTIGNLYDLTDCLNQSSPGDEVTIKFDRAGKRQSARVRLSQRKGMQ